MVLSGSMEPAFYRGDILFLNKGSAPLRTGEIVVFNIEGRDIPIVHRIIKFHERKPGGRIDILTKVQLFKCSSHVYFGRRPQGKGGEGGGVMWGGI